LTQRLSETFFPFELAFEFLAGSQESVFPPSSISFRFRRNARRSFPVSSTAIEAAMVVARNIEGMKTMANIGTFTTTKNGFTGQIKTLALNVKARLERVENPSENGPQFRIYSGSVELGAGWQKQAKDTERDYISVKLDDPSFPAPIYATLIEVEGQEGLQLIWSRPNSNRD
jgi:uncharacterized protein (DUF736 family)